MSLAADSPLPPSQPMQRKRTRAASDNDDDFDFLSFDDVECAQHPQQTPTPNSSPSSSSPTPLTHGNLRLHTLQSSSSSATSSPPRSTSPSSHTMSTNNSTKATNSYSEDKARLFRHNVRVWSTANMPACLQDFCDTVVKAVRRDDDPPPSPAAENLHVKQPRAQMENESTAISMVENDLLFYGANLPGGVQNIIRAKDATFDKHFVVDPGTLSLPKPIPDAVVGYIPMDKAESSGLEHPFNEAEELVIHQNKRLTPAAHFPFITAQYKSAIGSKGSMHAALEGGRDGTGVTAFMHDFYTRSGIEFNDIDTCHFSLTCDMVTVHLFVHWRAENKEGRPVYHMQPIYRAELRNFDADGPTQSMQRLRKMLHNLLDHALGARLERIKSAIQVLAEQSLEVAKPPRKRSRTGTSARVSTDDGTALS